MPIHIRRQPMAIPTREEALPGRAQPVPVSGNHLVLGTPLEGPWPEGFERATFAMGCFWGAEKFLWQVPGVYSSFVGYTGGPTPNPWYDEVCSQLTGHAEAAVVIYDPGKASYEDFLKVFWENHDPTQLHRQGGDVGTQYRSAIYVHDEAQRTAAEASRERYQAELTKAGYGPIVTEITEAGPFYYAEPYHQQYLARNPRGYCNHGFCQAAYPGGGVSA
ncbi:MAG: peptide-methionine (S)-S-oxide reductase MsrA [Dehalococcoidia bacterium]|nr:peptide-methionine (S)-S-oxide reductase MsrA [Dehalococcoidia bacterium]